MMSEARIRGFSLVELMITILIVAVLTAIAWPSFRDFLHRNQVSAQANQVLASLQYARNEAVGRRYPAAMCGSASTSNPTPTCDGGNTFESGWLVWRSSVPVFVGAPAYIAGTDELLRVTQPQTNISIRSFLGITANNLIAFDQRGAVIGAAGVQSQVVVCAMNTPADVTNGYGSSTDRVLGKIVRIDASGRIAVGDLAVGLDCSTAH